MTLAVDRSAAVPAAETYERCGRGRFDKGMHWSGRSFLGVLLGWQARCASAFARLRRDKRRLNVGFARALAPVVAQEFFPAGSRDFRIPCSRAGSPEHGTGDWKVAITRRQECRRYGGVPVVAQGIPACASTRLSQY